MIWIIVGYMWLFLHRPFEVWPWMGAYRIERIYMICTLIAWMAMAEKQLTENKINFAILLMAFAMIASAILSPYTTLGESATAQNWLKYLAFYLLVMTSVKTEKDLKIIITAFLVAFFLYMLHSYREFLNGRHMYSMGTVRMIGVDSTLGHPNSFGASVVYFFPMLIPLFSIIKAKWHYLFVIGYALLSVRCIQLTGSRTAFVVLIGTLILGGLLSKHRMKVLPVLALALVVIWATMSDSLRNRYLTLVDSTINESANESADGRLHGFWKGLECWQMAPLTGVGPSCHGIATGEGFASHFLYGQIPGELGTLGVVAYLTLLACYVMNHMSMIQYYRFMQRRGRAKEAEYCYRVSLAVMIGLFLLLVFGFGGHNGYRFNWVWFAAFQATAMSILERKVNAIRQCEMALPNAAPSLSVTPVRLPAS